MTAQAPRACRPMRTNKGVAYYAPYVAPYFLPLIQRETCDGKR